MAATADLHGKLPVLTTPVDVLCIAGDLAPDFLLYRRVDPAHGKLRQTEWLSTTYAEWEDTVPAKHILVTPGNHDWWNRMPDTCRSRVLIDEGVVIEGRGFYGTPWVSTLDGRWNYELSRSRRKERFANIPHQLDVLIAHTPAHKCMDRTHGGDDAGCPELRQVIQRKCPHHVFFGHIHEGQRHGCDAKLGLSDMHHVSLWGQQTAPRLFHI